MVGAILTLHAVHGQIKYTPVYVQHLNIELSRFNNNSNNIKTEPKVVLNQKGQSVEIGQALLLSYSHLPMTAFCRAKLSATPKSKSSQDME